MSLTLELLMAGLLAAAQAQSSPTAVPSHPLASTVARRGDRVEVTDSRQTIRGQLVDLTANSVVLEGVKGAPEGSGLGSQKFPWVTVQKIDRLGDSLVNGTAIGAAVGGATALGVMVKLCTNNRCSDISSNLDPRTTLLGTLLGAGVGALIDAVFEGRTTVYRTGQPPAAPARVWPETNRRDQNDAVVFGRFGRGGVSDDEGGIGSGGVGGAGIVIPIGRRVGVQIAYDRQSREREFEFGRRFFGTEQLLTAKALYFFRPSEPVRPYAGLGIGIIDSKSGSESPTFILDPRGFPVAGPVEIFSHRSGGGTLGVCTGLDARIGSRLAVLGDLTLDLGGPEALGSTRLTLGAGWRF